MSQAVDNGLPVTVSTLDGSEGGRDSRAEAIAHKWRWIIVAIFTFLIFAPTTDLNPNEVDLSVLVVRLRDLLVYSSWVVVLFLAGAAVIARTRRPESASLEVAGALLIGAAAVGDIFLLVGLAGQFNPSTLKGVAIAGLVIGTSPKTLNYVGHLLRRFKAELSVLFHGRSGKWLAVLLVSGLILLFPFTLGRMITWDASMYHVAGPSDFLAEGRIFLPDDNLQVAFLASPQMVGTLPLTVGAPSFLAFLGVVCLGLIVVLVGTHLSRWVSPEAGKVGVVLVLASNGLLHVSTIQNVDTVMVLSVLAVVLAIVCLDFDTGPASMAFLGALAGASFLTKYQAIPYLLGATLVFLIVAPALSAPIHPKTAGGGVLIFLALIAPFLLKNWVLFRAPFYPFLTQPMLAPWVANVGLSLPPDAGEFVTAAQAREQFSVFAWFARPGSLTLEGDGFMFGFPLAYVVGGATMFTRHRRLGILLAVPAIVGSFLIIWVSPLTNPRYLLPVFPLFAMITAAAIVVIGAGSRKVVKTAIYVLVGSMIVVSMSQWIGFERSNGRWTLGAGLESQAEWAQRPINFSQRDLMALNDELGARGIRTGERVLLLYEARGFDLGNYVIQDNSKAAWQYVSAAIGATGCLDPDEVRFIAFAKGNYRYLLSRGVTRSDLAADEWELFKERCLVLRSVLAVYELYEVVPGGVNTDNTSQSSAFA